MGTMAKSNEQIAREQRLAAKLRENLRRRKEQARARAADGGADGVAGDAPPPPAGLKPVSGSDS